MVKSQDLQAATTQVAILAAMAAVRAMREVYLKTEPHTRKSPEEPHRPRQTGPIKSQPAFDWKVPDRYVELLNFEMEVSDVLQAKAYDPMMKRRCPL